MQAKRLVYAMLLGCGLSAWFAPGQARAVDVRDPLTAEKLDEAWLKDLSDKSKGAFGASPAGLVLKSEWRHYGLLRRRNESAGSDANPLNVGVFLTSEQGFGIAPGLHLIWDNKNYISFTYVGENHLHVRWAVDGRMRERPFYNVVPDAKKNGVGLRLTLLSRNVVLSCSAEGGAWRKLGSMNGRPGKEGVAPGKIALGKGWPGEPTDPNARPDLANDYYPDANARLIATTFRDFHLYDTVPALPPALEFEKRDRWSDSLKDLEAQGVPRNWQLLGPRPDRDFSLFRRKEGLPPDTTDDWKTVPLDEAGKPFRTTNWSRPEDDYGTHVDLSEILEPKSQVLAYARTEIDWPENGPAMFYLDIDGMAEVYLNNRKIFGDQRRDGRAARDGRAIPVQLKQGINVVKFKISQSRGAWGFHFRAERSNPGYRIRVLERLMELYPDEARGWRGFEAQLLIPKLLLSMEAYPAALAAYEKATAACANDDDYRVQAFVGQLALLDMLRDFKALAAAGEKYLAQFPSSAGSRDAVRAVLRGLVLSGQADAAEARAKILVEQAGTSGAECEWVLRALAAAWGEADQWDKYAATLDRLAGLHAVDPGQRARAAFDAAFTRVHVEHWRATNRETLDTVRLAAAVQSAKKGLELLPASRNPQVQALAKEGDEDLKAGRHERAAASYWGAVLLALAGSSPDGAYFFSLQKTYKAPDFAMDPATKQLKDRNQALKDLDAIRGPLMGQVAYPGPWKAIGPFENTDGVGERTPYGPETNADLNAKHPGKGGEKAWVDLDPAKGGHDLGQDLKAFLGETKEGVVYLARDIEVAQERQTTLHLAVRSGWFAWLDGKPIGEDTEERFRVDGARIAVNLKPGKHRLLLKLVSPSDGGPLTFRCHVGDEPELAQFLLSRIWTAQAYHQIGNYPGWYTGLDWLLNWCHGKINAAALQDLGEAIAFVYPLHDDLRFTGLFFPTQRLMEEWAYGEAAAQCQRLNDLLCTWVDYGDKRGGQAWAATERQVRALVLDGETSRADRALGEFIARYPFYRDAVGVALVMRGALRVDLSSASAAQPLYERAARELPPGHYFFQHVSNGLRYTAQYRPERSLFTTDHDVQSAVEGAWRQMKAANPEDVERAMRNLGGVLRGDASSLLRVSDAVENPRYVGVREYIRAILSGLDGDARGIYQKVVANAAEDRYRAAVGEGDPAALEAVASAYPYTSTAARALNRAANLYLDRGEFAQAASALHLLLQEYRGLAELSYPLAGAKLAHALARDGQVAEARLAAERLSRDFGREQVTIQGRDQPAGEFALQVLARLGQNAGGATDSAVFTYAGNLKRTGAPLNGPAPQAGNVAWVRAQVPGASLDAAMARFGDVPGAQLPGYPAVAEGRAYLSTPESLAALDLGTGRLQWRATWGSSGALLRTQFSGFPISCPEVRGNRVYIRAVGETQSYLECRDAADGRLIWSTAAVPELKRAVWLSDPVVAYGMAIAVFLEPGDMNTHGIAAVDAESGRFRWKNLLVTGNSGFKTQYEYLGSSLQLGPPAVDGGVIYAPTGLNSLAALNAFTGEAVWISGYPKLSIPAIDWGGQAAIYETVRPRVLKLMSRGPCAPVVAERTVVLAPKDAPGLFGFDRKSGAIRWHLEQEDARFVAGLHQDRVLVVDHTAQALDADTGRQAWHYDLNGERLYGHPGYSGGVLYLPTLDRLQLVDAATGKLKSSAEWDPRTGPVANLVVVPQGILGLNDRLAVFLNPPGAPRVELPLLEAQALAAEGKWEAAAERFARAAQDGDPENVLAAVTGRVTALGKLGKQQEGLADIDRLLEGKEAIIKAQGGWWQVEKSVLAETLRARLGQAPPPVPPVPKSLTGTLGYAWQLPGSDPRLIFPADGPQDRFFAHSGNTISMLRLSAQYEALWQNYVGPGMQIAGIKGSHIFLKGAQKLVMLDRDSGERIWQRFLPTEEPRRRKAQARRSNLRGFNFAAFGEDSVAAVAGDALFVFNVRTGEEIWSNYRYDRRCLGIVYAGGKLIEFAGHSDRNTYFYAYDPLKGTRVKTEIIDRKRVENVSTHFSPDFKYMVYRPQGNRLAAVDLVTGKNAWELAVPRLIWNGYGNYGLRFTETGLISYFGDSHDNNDRGWHTLIINPADGKIVRHFRGGTVSLGEEFSLQLREDWGRTIARRDNDKGEKDIWVYQYPQGATDNHGLLSANLSKDKDRLYLLYVRRSDSESDQFVLRTFDWNTGQLLQSEFLPGTPLRLSEGWGFRNQVEQRGSLLLVGTGEGLFAYAPQGASRADAIANLKQTLADPNLGASQRRDSRRALAALEPTALQAFIAPTNVKVDGDTSDWTATDALALDDATHWMPLADGAKWNGPEDCSARVCAAWDGKGLYLMVEVKDDKFAPPAPGVEPSSGDSIRVAVNGLTNPYLGFDTRENVVCSLALVEGRTVLNTTGNVGADEENMPDARAVRSPNGKGMRYELFLPWPLVRRHPSYRPGDRKELRVGVAIFDRDENTTKGAMEWGAAVTGSSLVPARMGQLSLLDISVEKIERYREIIHKIPDAPEVMKYLGLILATRRGPKADQERVAELEGFLKQRPQSAHAFEILTRLQALYKSAGEADARARAIQFAKTIKCTPIVVDALSAQTMKGIGLRGEYFGTRNFTDLKLERTDGVLNFDWTGAPGPGVAGENFTVRWTGELVPKFSEEYTIYTISDDGVRLWINDQKLIENWTDHGPTEDSARITLQAGKAYSIRIEFFQGGGPSCLKLLWSSKGQAKEPVPQAQLNSIPAGNALKLETVAQDPARQQDAYRAAARMLSDSADGLVFLKRVLDGYKADDRGKKCIQECEDFLRAMPDTPNALAILQMLQALYSQDGDKNPMLRCERVMQDCKVSRENRRAFYSQYAPAWTEWQVIGPFQGIGERRGMDQTQDPEKNVDRGIDLTWKTKGPGETDLAWTKLSFTKDKQGRPQDGYIRLAGPLLEKFDKNLKNDISRGPYYAYAYTKFKCPNKRAALLLFGVNDVISIWVNGRKVVNERYPGPQKDREAVQVRLKEDDNEILIKTACPSGQLHFIFRLSDENGRPFDDLKMQE